MWIKWPHINRVDRTISSNKWITFTKYIIRNKTRAMQFADRSSLSVYFFSFLLTRSNFFLSNRIAWWTIDMLDANITIAVSTHLCCTLAYNFYILLYFSISIMPSNRWQTKKTDRRCQKGNQYVWRWKLILALTPIGKFQGLKHYFICKRIWLFIFSHVSKHHFTI